MRDQVEAKLRQSQEQLAIWRQKLAQAQQDGQMAAEQCQRWDAAGQVCRELLALSAVELLEEDVPVVLAEQEGERLAKAEKQLAEAIAELKEYGGDPDWSMGQIKAYLVQKQLADV